MRQLNWFIAFSASIISIAGYNTFQSKPIFAQPTPDSKIVSTSENNPTLLTLSQANYLSQLEKEVIVEMNKVRKNPQSYISIMEEYKKRFQGNKVQVAPRKLMLTKEGVVAVDEAIEFLKKQASLGDLAPSQGMSSGARDHANDQGTKGLFGHYGSDQSDPFIRIERYGKWRVIAGENIAYGYTTAQDIVMQLIIDDGVPHRGHRTTMFNPDFKITGIAIGNHSVYKTICVITYAGGYEDKIKPQEQSSAK